MRLITLISAGAFMVASAFMMKKENATLASSLYDSKWTLQKIHTAAVVEEVQTKAFIKFNEVKKSVGGNGSCNTFGSSFTITNNEISFKNIFSTKMYCEGMQQTEDAFFRQLEKVNRFEVKDNTLLLYQDKVALLEFITD